nr:oocyte maturation-inhibiting substance, OMIS=surfactin [Bacillus sp. (in: firmicutes)]
ELLVDLL